ncbi:MAG: hypothetical protein ABI229_09380 [Gemmatimonadaceae bacterium]
MINVTFLEHLSAARSDAEFTRTAAGLAVLQVYDSIKNGGFDPFIHQDALQRVEADIGAVECESNVRAALRTIVQMLPFWDSQGCVRVGRQATYTALMIYGQALGDEGEWSIAENVYALVGMDAELDGETWYSAEARLLMGRASRMCADWEASRIAYNRAYELGRVVGDQSICLRARIGDANNLWSRGDFPGATKLLNATARRAKRSCPDVLPRITLALAGVANAAGEYERAIHLAFGLLDSLDDSDELTYQALVDLAIFLTDYGLPPVAAAALRLVERAAPEPRIRRQAKLNLFFLAAQHEPEEAFTELRNELATERLTIREQTQFALFSAQGLRRFSHFDAAHTAANRALELANRHELFQFVFETEAELREIASARSEKRAAAMPGPARSTDHGTRLSGATSGTYYRFTTGGKVPSRIRHIAKSLETMAAERFAATDLNLSSAL